MGWTPAKEHDLMAGKRRNRIPVEHIDEGELLERAARNDTDAVRELLRRSAPGAWGLALAICGTTAAAAEAVTTGFASAVAALHAGDRDTSVNFRPHVLAATRAAALEHGEELADHVDELVATATAGVTDPLLLDAARAFSELPEAWRSALWLADVVMLPDDQLEVPLGETTANAEAMVLRARDVLHQNLQRRLAEEITDDECKLVTGQLSSLLAGHLDDLAADAVHDHLSSCGECRARRERLVSATDRLAGLAPHPPIDLERASLNRWRIAVGLAAVTTGPVPIVTTGPVPIVTTGPVPVISVEAIADAEDAAGVDQAEGDEAEATVGAVEPAAEAETAEAAADEAETAEAAADEARTAAERADAEAAETEAAAGDAEPQPEPEVEADEATAAAEAGVEEEGAIEAPETEADGKAEAEAEAEAKAETEAEAETTAETETEAETEAQAETGPEAEPEVERDTAAEPEPVTARVGAVVVSADAARFDLPEPAIERFKRTVGEPGPVDASPNRRRLVGAIAAGLVLVGSIAAATHHGADQHVSTALSQDRGAAGQFADNGPSTFSSSTTLAPPITLPDLGPTSPVPDPVSPAGSGAPTTGNPTPTTRAASGPAPTTPPPTTHPPTPTTAAPSPTTTVPQTTTTTRHCVQWFLNIPNGYCSVWSS